MIKVHGLYKRFGAVEALSGVNFEIARGEIIGLLGPNGAGKTTLMRILSTYLTPDNGSVRVAGRDVSVNPVSVRSSIGCFLEKVPVYSNLRVLGFLRFIARMRGLTGQQTKEETLRICEECHLGSHVNSLNKYLSKGTLTRVGLAAAFVGNPQILILDEPTLGLDPNEARHIRELIRTMAWHRTVIFSSHILSEVEQFCDRVIILDNGRIIAMGTPRELSEGIIQGQGRLRIEVDGPSGEVQGALSRLPAVDQVEPWKASPPATAFLVRTSDEGAFLLNLAALIHERHWKLTEYRQIHLGLEEIFFNLTGEDRKR